MNHQVFENLRKFKGTMLKVYVTLKIFVVYKYIPVFSISMIFGWAIHGTIFLHFIFMHMSDLSWNHTTEWHIVCSFSAKNLLRIASYIYGSPVARWSMFCWATPQNNLVCQPMITTVHHTDTVSPSQEKHNTQTTGLFLRIFLFGVYFTQ